MKKVEILSGNFATGEGNKGNFNGYDDDGVRYFVAKRVMESQGWKTDKDVKYPFWAKADTKQIGQLDANGEPASLNGVPVVVDRLQVVSIFKTREALVESCINKASIDIEIQAGVQARATSSGLTAEGLKALLEVVF